MHIELKRPYSGFLIIAVVSMIGITVGSILIFVAINDLNGRTRDQREQTDKHQLSGRAFALTTSGQLVAIDLASQTEIYSIEAGLKDDAILSPDGQRLYTADAKSLIAFDTSNGAELWRVAIDNPASRHPTGPSLVFRPVAFARLGQQRTLASIPSAHDSARELAYFHGGQGRTTFATSPNGELIFIKVAGRIQARHFSNGSLSVESDYIGESCLGRLHPTPDLNQLYVFCQTTTRFYVVSLTSGKILEIYDDAFPSAIYGTAQSRDSKFLYVLTANGQVYVWDLEHRVLKTQSKLTTDGRVSEWMFAYSDWNNVLYVGFSTAERRFESDEIRLFDAESWKEIQRISINPPMRSHDLIIAPGETLYTINTTMIGSYMSSTIVQLDPDGNRQGILLNRVNVVHLLVSP